MKRAHEKQLCGADAILHKEQVLQPEAQAAEAAQGAYVGLVGENIDITIFIDNANYTLETVIVESEEFTIAPKKLERKILICLISILHIIPVAKSII